MKKLCSSSEQSFFVYKEFVRLGTCVLFLE